MLQLMLHAHPRIAIPPENRFLLPTYTGRREFGDLRDADNRRKVARSIVGKGSHFKDLGLDKKEIVREIVAGPPTVGSAIGTVFRAYARRFDKPRWGDKRPAYHHFLPFVLRMFPDAQIIQIVRDGRACVASLKRMPWWTHDTPTAIAEWALAFDNCRRYARTLPADTFHEIRYENLVAEPDVELKSLCAFLGEDYDEAMSKPKDQATVAVPTHKKWHVATHQDVSSDQVAKWQQELDPWEIELCETVLGSRLRSYGYELTGAGRPSASALFTYAKRSTRRRQSQRRRLLTDRLALLRDRHPVADQRSVVH